LRRGFAEFATNFNDFCRQLVSNARLKKVPQLRQVKAADRILRERQLPGAACRQGRC
jgi:hypothetical protein